MILESIRSFIFLLLTEKNLEILASIVLINLIILIRDELALSVRIVIATFWIRWHPVTVFKMESLARELVHILHFALDGFQVVLDLLNGSIPEAIHVFILLNQLERQFCLVPLFVIFVFSFVFVLFILIILVSFLLVVILFIIILLFLLNKHCPLEF